MAFDFDVVIAGAVSIVCAVVTVFVFKVYGAFKHPWGAWSLMLISAIIPLVMVIGILPYDISLCLFGQDATKEYTTLRLVLEVLYWVSFVLTWVVNPIIVSFLRYKESLSLKHRIWLTIKENIIVYGIILGVVVVGVIILMATGNLTLNNLFPLAISLANGYGLLILCFCLGHGLIALPRTIWQMATPEHRYLFHLHKIAQETKTCATTVADAKAIVSYCDRARSSLGGYLATMYEEVGNARAVKLHELLGDVAIPDRFFRESSENKKFEKIRRIDWAHCSTSQLEDFFALADETIDRLDEASKVLQHSGQSALTSLQQYQKSHSKITTVLRRAFSVILFVVNGVCLWGELALIFKPELSIFYMLSHMSMPSIISILGVSTPILAYLVFVGSWSLTHLRLGSFFKFTKGCTNANTLNYFAIILCRLGPTIGFHYIQQIRAEGSEFQKVMGVMDVIVFIGTKWNIYSPILLVLLMLFFLFNVPDKLKRCCGKDDGFSLDYTVLNHKDLEAGEEVLKIIQPEAGQMIDEGLTWAAIEANTRKKTKNGTGIKEHLNDEPHEDVL